MEEHKAATLRTEDYASNKPAYACCPFDVDFLLCLRFEPDQGGDMFIRNDFKGLRDVILQKTEFLTATAVRCGILQRELLLKSPMGAPICRLQKEHMLT
jgi:hypothetical protein